MKRGTLSNLKSDFYKRRRRAETWLERALSFPDCAPTELAAIYVNLTGEELFTENLIFDADGLRDTQTDICYIYPHPDEPARICYGADGRDWPVDDESLWPWKLSKKKLSKDEWLSVLVHLAGNDLLSVGLTSKQMYTYSRLARLRQTVDRYPALGPLRNRPEVFTEKPYLWRAASCRASELHAAILALSDHEIGGMLENDRNVYPPGSKTEYVDNGLFAAAHGDVELLRKYLDMWDSGDCLNAADDAAHCAAERGHPCIIEAIVNEKRYDYPIEITRKDLFTTAFDNNQSAVAIMMIEQYGLKLSGKPLKNLFNAYNVRNAPLMRFLARKYPAEFILWCSTK